MEIKDIVEKTVLDLCSDKDMSLSETHRFTSIELSGIAYLAENRLQDIIHELFEEAYEEETWKQN